MADGLPPQVKKELIEQSVYRNNVAQDIITMSATDIENLLLKYQRRTTYGDRATALGLAALSAWLTVAAAPWPTAEPDKAVPVAAVMLAGAYLVAIASSIWLLWTLVLVWKHWGCDIDWLVDQFRNHGQAKNAEGEG